MNLKRRTRKYATLRHGRLAAMGTHLGRPIRIEQTLLAARFGVSLDLSRFDAAAAQFVLDHLDGNRFHASSEGSDAVEQFVRILGTDVQ